MHSPQLPNYAARQSEHVIWSPNKLFLIASLLEQSANRFITQMTLILLL